MIAKLDNGHKLSLNFLEIYSQRILDFGLGGLNSLMIFPKKKNFKKRIVILTVLPYRASSRCYIFYQAFLNFTNSLWEKYVNQFWLPHKESRLIRGFNFRFCSSIATLKSCTLESIRYRVYRQMKPPKYYYN